MDTKKLFQEPRLADAEPFALIRHIHDETAKSCRRQDVVTKRIVSIVPWRGHARHATPSTSRETPAAKRGATVRRRDPRHHVRVITIALLTTVHGVSAAADLPEVGDLDAHDGKSIAQYDARIGMPMISDQCEAMTTKSEWCVTAGRPCELPCLHRWDDPPTLSVPLSRDVGARSEAAHAAMSGFDVGLTFVADSIGRDVASFVRFAGPTVRAEDALVLVAVAPCDELRRLAVAWERFMPGLDLAAGAGIGLTQDVACRAVASDGAQRPGHLTRGFVFLDSDLPPRTLLRCGKEEAFNLFIGGDPIGDASLFDDPWGRGSLDPVLGEQFSSRDEVLLRLLHHRLLSPGMSADAARAAAADAIRQDCR